MSNSSLKMKRDNVCMYVCMYVRTYEQGYHILYIRLVLFSKPQAYYMNALFYSMQCYSWACSNGVCKLAQLHISLRRFLHFLAASQICDPKMTFLGCHGIFDYTKLLGLYFVNMPS